MTRYMTPAKAAEAMNLPVWMLRSMIKEGKCPGFFRGNRFYVNTLLLAEKLESESKANMKQ